MSKNGNLHAAKRAKNDEFYTQLTDIENELQHYWDFFKGKAVYCNCDHPTESNFPRYFLEHFDELGLERLTATCYMPDGRGWKGTKSKGGEYTVEQLDGDLDFRSDECVGLLKQADAVVTNPPFSLFREYVKQLMEYGKKFLVIGNQNAITFKEVFPYIMAKKILLGCTPVKGFIQPDGTVKKFGNIGWFTNIQHAPAGKPLILEKHYCPEDYPRYDNYNAIEVSRTADIPIDYYGVMGVPISFLSKYSPDQFEIVGITENAEYLRPMYIDGFQRYDRPYLDGKRMYSRLLIIKRNDHLEPADFDIVGLMSGAKDTTLINGDDGRAKFYVSGKGVYARVLIRRK